MASGNDTRPEVESIFGAHAPAMCRAGFAVLPANGKRPLRAGFNKWKAAPGLSVVEKWAQHNPGANIVYIPGLSRNRFNPNGIVVVDADDASEVERVRELFGDTPGRVNTRRGKHFLYRAPDATLGNIGSLREFGLNIDIKHGQRGAGIVVAPPSRNDKDPTITYAWDNCDPNIVDDLPIFDIKALNSLTGKGSKTLPYATEGSEMPPNVTETAPPPALTKRSGLTIGKAYPHLFRSGSRKLGLNDHLCAHAWAIEDFNSCVDIARSWNDDLVDQGIDPLPDDEVMEVCKAILSGLDSGKIIRLLHHRAICISDADEIRWLMGIYTNGAEAFSLLQLLRAEHGARASRGETFAIAIKAMMNAGIMGRWDARRYRNARDTLIDAGLLRQVSPPKSRKPAQYVLTERARFPSVAMRAGRNERK